MPHPASVGCTDRSARRALDRNGAPLPLTGPLLESARQRLESDYRMLSDDLGWSALLLTVAAVYLHRVARVDRFSLGLPVHNRSDAGARALVGPVMEVFPVDVAIEPGDSFRSLHKRIARSLLQTLRHAVAGTAPPADYEAVVNVIARAGLGSFGDLPATTEWVHSGASDPSHLFRLQLTGYGAADLELVLDLNEAAADDQHRQRAPEHALAVLRADGRRPRSARRLRRVSARRTSWRRCASWEVGLRLRFADARHRRAAP